MAAPDADSISIKMKNGEDLLCQGACVKGDFLIIMTQYGQTKVHRSFLAPEAEQSYFGTPPGPSTANPAPASPPAAEKPAAPQQPSASSTETQPTPLPALTPPGAATLPPEKNDPSQITWPTGEPFSDYPEFVLLPEPDLPQPQPDAKVKTGKFKLPNVGPHRIEVEVIYRVPVSGPEETSQAHNMVFYCPFPTENTNLAEPHHLFVTDALGCSLVTFKFSATPEELSDPTRCYWKKKAGWFEAVLAAQDKVCELFKLEKRKLILTSISGGSNMAEGVAVSYPDRIEAVVLMGGEDYDMPIPSHSPVKWLVMNTRGDSTGPANKRIAGELLAGGASVLYSAPPPNHGARASIFYHHVPSLQSRHLVNAFVWGVVRGRTAGSSTPFEQLYPYTVLPGESRKFQIESTSRLPAEARRISPKRLFFNSSALAFSWAQVVPNVQKIDLGSGKEKAKIFLGFPAQAKPKAVVLVYDALSYLNYAEIHEDATFLAELGMMAVAPAQMGKSASLDAYLKTTRDWIGNQPTLQGLPVYCYGKGKAGANFLAAVSDNPYPNMAGFAYLDLSQEAPEQEPRDKIKQMANQYDAFLFGMKGDESGENKELGRLADGTLNRKAEKRGSKKILFRQNTRDGGAYGDFLLALADLIDPPPADDDKDKQVKKK